MRSNIRITRRAGLKRLTLVAGASALPAWFVSSSPAATTSEAQHQPTEDERAEMARIARKFLDEYKVPGLSVAIARHGRFVYREAFGYADNNSREQTTSAHRFRIASISKPITSVAIFLLIEQGKLKLEDLAFGPKAILGMDYGKSYPEDVLKITVHNLLTHTSGGWTNDGNDPMFREPAFNHRELITWTLQNQPLKHAPGEHYAYSNFGYCVLGRVIEKISGQSYADFVRQHIAMPCGIKELRIAGNARADRAPDEVTYHDSRQDNPYTMNVARMDSHGGWLATPNDMVRFAMHVDGFKTTPNILRSETIATMTKPGSVNANYACGWSVNRFHNWWHGGSLPGLNTIMVRTGSGLCWAAFVNTRTKDIGLALDQLVWKMVRAVPAWRA